VQSQEWTGIWPFVKNDYSVHGCSGGMAFGSYIRFRHPGPFADHGFGEMENIAAGGITPVRCIQSRHMI
jgi:hypothetical protein